MILTTDKIKSRRRRSNAGSSSPHPVERWQSPANPCHSEQFWISQVSSNMIDFDRALEIFTNRYFQHGQDREPRWRGGSSAGQRHVPPLWELLWEAWQGEAWQEDQEDWQWDQGELFGEVWQGPWGEVQHRAGHSTRLWCSPSKADLWTTQWTWRGWLWGALSLWKEWDWYPPCWPTARERATHSSGDGEWWQAGDGGIPLAGSSLPPACGHTLQRLSWGGRHLKSAVKTTVRVTLIVGLPPRLTSFWIISSQNF